MSNESAAAAFNLTFVAAFKHVTATMRNGDTEEAVGPLTWLDVERGEIGPDQMLYVIGEAHRLTSLVQRALR